VFDSTRLVEFVDFNDCSVISGCRAGSSYRPALEDRRQVGPVRRAMSGGFIDESSGKGVAKMAVQSQTLLSETVPAEGRRDFSWILGCAAAFAFYMALPYIPIDDNFKYRYFNSHWIEHTTVTLFCVGMAILGGRLLRWPLERGILSENVLDGLKLDSQANATETAQRLSEHLRLAAKRYQSTELYRRVESTSAYVAARQTAADLESHLSYLADTAMARLHGSYAALRTITWAIPILGFLGTVIGITMAIANVTPEQLESSLNEVTSGLAVAFDTTALSLALSMILVFATFAIERGESSVLDRIEDFSVRRLLGLFPVKEEAPQSPLMAAEHEVAKRFLEQADLLVRQHLKSWDETVASCRDQWSLVASNQGAELAAALSTGISAALESHRSQLLEMQQAARHEAEEMRRSFTEQLAMTRNQLSTAVAEQLQSVLEAWNEAQDSQREVQAQLVTAVTGATTSIHEEVLTLATSLREVGHGSLEQAQALERQTIQIGSLISGGQKLVEAETLLAENLATLRQTQTLEETLLNLNAAVHLLSARTHHRAA
jgi:biopolymer transport protein ExbB/TolQ